MAVEMADLIKDELDQHLDAVHFYSDSKVVLGYIYNESKRFYTYVHNRVQRIRQSSKPTQWHYVRTEENPADHASRSLTPSQLAKSTWLTGPSFIYHPPVENKTLREMFELVEPEKDLDEMTQARHVILKETQMATFEKELSALRANKPIPRQSPLLKLSPVLVNGLIAVGGRLEHSEVDNSEKNPIVIPKDSYISLLLTRHYHKQDKVHLTHEVLCTVMAEVTAIINARPLLPVSSDPENPFILSPSMLLTQKSCLPPPPGTFLDKDLYIKQWRQVQALADQFWTRWRREYLPTLQKRQKWTVSRPNLQVDDLVLLKDKQVTRNSWPMARVTATFLGKDNRVRKWK
ncbi:hypothetical protein D4764_0155010 [Takifugu flavidus]|uniref:DUF5641 domain-containing protein n=1 Tax=Takifugu flavidus TaxID=433684 RepID=A0A5C6MHP2_9TELE|nr:hypothetical protein D4764_0155010 [Takifugu flavidus]